MNIHQNIFIKIYIISKEHLFEIEIFCNIINVFDQFNAE